MSQSLLHQGKLGGLLLSYNGCQGVELELKFGGNYCG